MPQPIKPVNTDVAYGMMAAIQVALRAMIASHPDADALIRAFHEEHEGTMAFLIAQDVPDNVLEVYQDTLKGISPNTDIVP